MDLLLEASQRFEKMELRAALSVDTRDLLAEWLDGTPIGDITAVERVDRQDVTEFIEDSFAYRLPWGVSAYLKIASFVTNVPQVSTLSTNVAGMIKYGLPSPESVWAMSAGVASRLASIIVANEFLGTDLDRNVQEFRRWLGRLDPESAAERLGLAGAELESAAKAILRSQPNEYLDGLDGGSSLLPMRATCRPSRTAIDSGLLYELKISDRLGLHRDHESRLHRKAVFVSTRTVVCAIYKLMQPVLWPLNLDLGSFCSCHRR